MILMIPFFSFSDIQVWKAAATQIFYSLGPTFGGLVTLASYNKFDNNCHRDAILVSFINCGTSVFAGFVVFSFLGFMAHTATITSGVPVTVDDVVSSGPGLAFIAYPDAFTNMPVPQLWSLLFFFMLLTLGLDSMFTFVETVTTAIMDHYRWLGPHKHWVVIGVCGAGFILGLSMCAQGGILMFTLIDATSASWNILLFAIIELILVAWMYGADNFMENIHEMGVLVEENSTSKWGKWFTRALKAYWKACWCYITPVLLFLVLVMQFVFASKVKYDTKNGEYIFPENIQALGWMLGLASTAFIPGIAAYQYLRRTRKGKDNTFFEGSLRALPGQAGLTFGGMLRPTPRWGSVKKS